jgi:hypothetical protein
MNNATVDCAHFATAVDKIRAGEESIAAAITNYEEEVINRGIYEANLSRNLTLTIHDWERFLESPIMKYGGNLAREIKEPGHSKIEAPTTAVVEGTAV